jgi:hypothetical protein
MSERQFHAAMTVSPQIDCRAAQIGFGIRDLRMRSPELRENPNQRILEQVLAVPEIAGETATEARELRPMRRQALDEFAPGLAQIRLHRNVPFDFAPSPVMPPMSA